MTGTGKALALAPLPAAPHTDSLVGTALAAGLVLLLAQPPSAHGATSLTITTEDYAPYHMSGKNGEVTGFVTDKVREMLSRAHIRGNIELLPWKRAYRSATQHPDHCVFSTTRTAEREKQFKWVGPIARSDWALYALAKRHVEISRLEEARSYTIGTYNGDARDTFLRERGFRVDATLNDQLNPQKLLSGRIDLWVTDKYTANRLIHKNGWSKRIVPALSFNRVDLFLACHPATPDHIIAGLSGALGDMISDGTAARLEQRYDRWPG